MDMRPMLKLCGKTVLLLAAALLFPLAVSLYYGEDPAPFLYSVLLIAALGFAMARLPAREKGLPHNGFFAVGLIWLLFCVCGALPFYFSGYFDSVVDCLFESVSGFTTTSATVLTEVEHLSHGILLWRSMTNFLGGMGVLVLTIVLMPRMRGRSSQMVWAESTGPIKSKLVPKAAVSAKILYGIYMGLTLLMIPALLLAGMPLFDSVLNALATAGTGGLSIRNLSIASYGSPAVEVVITVFMLLFSVNFAVYFALLAGRWRQVMQSEELRFFFGLAGASTLLIAINIGGRYAPLTALRHAAFHTAASMSGTGFFTVNYDAWPEFSRCLLLLLVLFGACAGSTGGGLKLSRVLLLFKALGREIRQIFHPRSVTVVKLDGSVVEERVISSVHSYFAVYIVLILGGTLLVALDNHSFGTTLTSVVACINNIGPGLELVGPLGNYSIFSPMSKIVLSVCMILGRLEIYPMIILFSRAAWQKT